MHIHTPQIQKAGHIDISFALRLPNFGALYAEQTSASYFFSSSKLPNLGLGNSWLRAFPMLDILNTSLGYSGVPKIH